jgi:hypothetical protein
MSLPKTTDRVLVAVPAHVFVRMIKVFISLLKNGLIAVWQILSDILESDSA